MFKRMRQAMKNKPTSERVYRNLTADEQRRLTDARAQTETVRDEILAEGRLGKRALELAREQVRCTVKGLKAEREKLGLSLADVERRCGLKPSALSRLENDPDANPTLITLQRCASAVGLHIVAALEPDAV